MEVIRFNVRDGHVGVYTVDLGQNGGEHTAATDEDKSMGADTLTIVAYKEGDVT